MSNVESRIVRRVNPQWEGSISKQEPYYLETKTDYKTGKNENDRFGNMNTDQGSVVSDFWSNLLELNSTINNN